MEAALEAGAEDMVGDEEGFEVITTGDDFESVRNGLAKAGFGNPISAGIIMQPQNSVTLDEKQAASMLKLLDLLEDNDDVQRVHANFDIPDAIMEQLNPD